MTTYFAYGSNMNVAQMSIRCPMANCQGTAMLDGHDFLINQFGFATVIPKSQATVHGLLWTLSDADILSLDIYEGIAEGHYRKEHIGVRFNGQEVAAMVYIATDTTPGTPERSYLEGVVAAATGHGLPSEYVRRLAQWLSPRA